MQFNCMSIFFEVFYEYFLFSSKVFAYKQKEISKRYGFIPWDFPTCLSVV
nr:MAG TPA: LicD family [Caudoviricetes sp.]